MKGAIVQQNFPHLRRPVPGRRRNPQSLDNLRAASRGALIGAMPHLIRRRDRDAHQERWLIYYGDVHVRSVSLRNGNPAESDPWQWRCGFYPGSRPGECTSGTAASFESARAAFSTAWTVFLFNRTEADFKDWRQQRDWTARKYAAWERGERALVR